MKQNTLNKILEFFTDNDDLFNACIEELDSYNGYLNDDRYYPMYELDELLYGKSPSDILNLAFFGHDEDTWTTDSFGNKNYGDFNPNRDYFKFNGYGNLVSTNYIDYTSFLDEYAINEMLEYRDHIYPIDDNEELKALFDELEACEE